MDEDKFRLLVRDLMDGARECFSNDAPDIFMTYGDFERVMWSEDFHMHEWQATRDEYRQALQEAFRRWHRRRVERS